MGLEILKAVKLQDVVFWTESPYNIVSVRTQSNYYR